MSYCSKNNYKRLTYLRFKQSKSTQFMKNLGLIVIVSVLSSVLSVSIYKYFEEPTLVIRESAPVRYVSNGEASEEGVITNKGRNFLSSSPTNFTSAAESVTPGVVNIKSSQGGDFDFWGGNYGGSSGSGVIISADGYIITNNHVIEDGNTLEVTLNDNRKFSAKLIGKDPSTDIALIKKKIKKNAF